MQLESLFELRSFIEGKAKSDSSYELNWLLLLEMRPALNLVATMMTILQREDIYLSDIYAQWLLLIDQLKELETEYSQLLLNTIRQRFKNIFNSDCAPMIACIWMDPRYQISLNEEEKQIAKEHLTGLYERIVKMKENESDGDSQSAEEDDNVSKLEKLMKGYERESKKHANAILIGDILESFNNLERMSSKTDPLKFWSTKKVSAPQMHMLSQIVFAVPGTQAAIERNFSALNRTLTKFRSQLSDETLERILFMKCNHSLFGQNLFDNL